MKVCTFFTLGAGHSHSEWELELLGRESSGTERSESCVIGGFLLIRCPSLYRKSPFQVHIEEYRRWT